MAMGTGIVSPRIGGAGGAGVSAELDAVLAHEGGGSGFLADEEGSDEEHVNAIFALVSEW